MPLDTVGEYVSEARALLQDTATVKRYADTALKFALAMGVSQIKRVRPDLFIGITVPVLASTTVDTQALALDEPYRMALLSFVVGYVNLREEEGGNEQRAAMFMSGFATQMLALA